MGIKDSNIKKTNTREKILDAMYKNVYKQGYERTSIALLLKECEIAKGALYHHFTSKKEIMLCTLKERLSPAMDILFDDSKGENYRVVLETLEEISNSKELILNNCPYNKFNMELYRLDEDFKGELDDIFNTLTARLKRHLDAGVEAKVIKEVDTASLAEFIYANIWGVLSLSHTKEAYDLKMQHLFNYLETLRIK